MAADPYDLALNWRPACVTPSVTIGPEQDGQDTTGRTWISEPYLP